VIQGFGLYQGCSARRHALLVQFRAVADALAGGPDLLAGELSLAHGRLQPMVLPLAALGALAPACFRNCASSATPAPGVSSCIS
jgi:hypothetical protein